MGECYQWKATGQCSKGDSCSFRHCPASGNRCDQRHEGQSSSRASKAKAQTDGKRPSKSSGRRGEEPFWIKKKDSVPKFPWEKVYEPGMNTSSAKNTDILVGQRSKTTVDQAREEHFVQNGKLRTSHCPWIVVKFWYWFVLYIATAGLVKYIFKSSFRAR